MDPKYTTVENHYQIDEDEIHVRADGSDYWEKVQEFYGQVKSRAVASLSEGQNKWLEKIETQLLMEKK